MISFWNMCNIIIIMMQTTALKNIKEYSSYLLLLLKHILPVFYDQHINVFLLISIQNTYFIICNCHSINLIKVNKFQTYIVY